MTEFIDLMLDALLVTVYRAVDLLIAQPALLVVGAVAATLLLVHEYHPKDD